MLMKKPIVTICFLFMALFAEAQFFKNLGVKAGISNSYYEWKYRPNSVSNSVHNKSDKAIGLVFQLTSDLVDKKYWSVNISLGWLQKNAGGTSSLLSNYPSPIYSIEDSYQTTYISANPSVKGKLPLGKILNVYGQVGFNIDFMCSHSKNIESYFNENFFYTLQTNGELKKINYGFTFGPGIEKTFGRMTLRADYTFMRSFNNIIDATGPRLDGLGDQGFFLKMKSFTELFTFSALFKMKTKN